MTAFRTASACALLFSACGLALAGPSSQPDIRTTEMAAGPVDPIAKINGVPVAREQLTQLIYEAYGRRVLQDMVLLEVVKQNARQRQITITPADIEAEEAKMVPAEVLKENPNNRQRLIDELLERNNMTRVDWRLMRECRAYMRKMLANLPEPAEKDIRELFNRVYGQKVQVRLIQVRTPKEMAEVNRRLDRKEKFEIVAQELSQHKASKARGGLMEFDRDDPALPKEVRDVAFEGLTSPGDVSGDINAGDNIYKVQFVTKLAPKEAKFEDERGKLAAMIRERTVEIQIPLQLQVLVSGANIEVLDPILKQQWDKKQDQPATPPGLK